MYKNIDTNEAVIGNKTDIHEAIGPIDELVDINKFYYAKIRMDNDNLYHNDDHKYVCEYCGYDRAIHKAHTEVDVHEATCQNCEITLAKWGNDL